MSQRLLIFLKKKKGQKIPSSKLDVTSRAAWHGKPKTFLNNFVGVEPLQEVMNR